MTAAMPYPDETTYFVIPLSVQKEGDGYYIGNAQIDAFYQFPEQGLRIIEWLREGCTATAIRSKLASDKDETVDVDDFVDTLKAIGFVYPDGDEHLYHEAVSSSDAHDKRLRFRASLGFARTVFSLPMLALYLGVLGLAAHAAIKDPRLRLNLDAFYLQDHLTLTLVLLLVLYGITASMHEVGHMLAAARHGVESRLGIGNRLWSLVAEADLSGILALPKSQRYLPFFGGMIVDLLSISLITLLLQWLLAQGHDGFIVKLLQALILQITLSISWQFNLFLKTDVYYVVCNYYGHPDLDREARVYLRDKLHTASFGLFGAKTETIDRRHLGVLRTFASLWLVGRIGALAFLFIVLIPTLVHYFERAQLAFSDPETARAVAYDAAAFAVISALLFLVGMYMWLRRKKTSK
jgi:putative peptide zinc metalloprotease protein